MQLKKPRVWIQNNLHLPTSITPEAFSSGLNYQAQPSDIFIASYPKCGTTWVQYIVWLILHDGEPLPEGKILTDVSPHLERMGGNIVAALPDPRVIKTHLPSQMTPHHSEAKYIYVARNPFDCVVSFYNQTIGFKHFEFADGTLDEYFECFMTGEVAWGDYFDNLLSWWERKDDSNILLVTYEDLRKDPKKEIKKIARLLGDEYSKRMDKDEMLQKIVERSSFESMRKEQQRWMDIKSPANMPPFIRKGQVGDWKNYFSPEMTQRLAKKLAVRTKGTGLENLWADVIPSLAEEAIT